MRCMWMTWRALSPPTLPEVVGWRRRVQRQRAQRHARPKDRRRVPLHLPIRLAYRATYRRRHRRVEKELQGVAAREVEFKSKV
jgi:hypothetical protein